MLTPVGAVVNSAFTSNPDNFTNGEAVTYQAPAPTLLALAAVNTDENGSPSAGSNKLYAPGNDYVNGERLTYNNNGTSGEPVTGLSNGGTYYVVNRTANTIQLAKSAAESLNDMSKTDARATIREAAGKAVKLIQK